MDHHILIIHQDPSSPDHSLLAERSNPFLFEGLLNPLGNGLNLAIGLAAAEEKIIGERSRSLSTPEEPGLGPSFQALPSSRARILFSNR